MAYIAEQAGFDLKTSYANTIRDLGDLDSAYGNDENFQESDPTPFFFQRDLNIAKYDPYTPIYDPQEPMILPEGVLNDLDEFLGVQPAEDPQIEQVHMDVVVDDGDVIELPPINVDLGQNRMSSHYANDLAYQIMDIDPDREITYYRPNLDRSVRRGRKRAFSEMEDDEKPKLITAIQRQLYMSTTHSSAARNQLSALMIVKESAFERTLEQVSDLGYNLLEFAETIKVKQRVIFIPKPNSQAVNQYREMAFQTSHLDARMTTTGESSAGPSIMASIMNSPPDETSSPKKKKKSRFDPPATDQLSGKKQPLDRPVLRSPIFTRSRDSHILDPDFQRALGTVVDDSDTLSLDAQPIE